MSEKSRIARKRRQYRMRRKISGTPERPRMNVFRSLEHIYVQVIDDVSGQTLISASTVDRDIVAEVTGKNKIDQARLVGKVIADRAQAAGISKVVFDRGGFIYHGRVKALAEGARESGLEF